MPLTLCLSYAKNFIPSDFHPLHHPSISSLSDPLLKHGNHFQPKTCPGPGPPIVPGRDRRVLHESVIPRGRSINSPVSFLLTATRGGHTTTLYQTNTVQIIWRKIKETYWNLIEKEKYTLSWFFFFKIYKVHKIHLQPVCHKSRLGRTHPLLVTQCMATMWHYMFRYHDI